MQIKKLYAQDGGPLTSVFSPNWKQSEKSDLLITFHISVTRKYGRKKKHNGDDENKGFSPSFKGLIHF